MVKYEPTGFALDIFRDRYAFTDTETWDEACKRVAKQMAVAELPDKVQKYEDQFYDILVQNLFAPGGRIMYGSGRNNPQLLNCFVLENELDSKEGWGQISYEMIVTSMTGGGCGINFSDVRPAGAEIRGHKGTCPGPLELMRLIDNNGYPVRAGGGRRTALMFALDMNHPDIMKFINAKKIDVNLSEEERKKLPFANANFSIMSNHTTEFIDAVHNDKELSLTWKGRYKSSVKARDIWNTLLQNAWDGAEPGILNWELVESESNIYYIEPMACVNPCGELPLPKKASCCLGHLVLHRFIKNNSVNWELLGRTIRTAVRFLDNVISVNNYPLPSIKEKTHKLRQIGLGTTGLADMLAVLGYRYGSQEANVFVDKLYRFISKSAYEASVLLAVEKGPFPACNPQLHTKSGYMKRMTPKIKALVEEHGIRNATILTQAPVGTMSIVCGNCSSGIEPMFAPAYYRNYRDGEDIKQELVFHPLFAKFVDEGKDTSHFVGSHELTIRDHFEIQKVIQRHVDSAISKTINMPKDQDIEEMGRVWLEYLPHVKGATFYRDGCRDHLFSGPQPLVPLAYDEALRLYNQDRDHTVDAEHVDDCPNGMCSL